MSDNDYQKSTAILDPAKTSKTFEGACDHLHHQESRTCDLCTWAPEVSQKFMEPRNCIRIANIKEEEAKYKNMKPMEIYQEQSQQFARINLTKHAIEVKPYQPNETELKLFSEHAISYEVEKIEDKV